MSTVSTRFGVLRELREAEVVLRRSVLARRFMIGGPFGIVGSALGLLVAHNILPDGWGVPCNVFLIPALLLSIAVTVASGWYIGESLGYEPPDLAELKIEELKWRLSSLADAQPEALTERQLAYRGEMLDEIEKFRRESKKYRARNNFGQLLIIVGSLVMATVSSLSQAFIFLRWGTVGVSLVVGIAAGVTGYYKYKDRAFYLQQTADEMESNITAYDIGLPPYDQGSPENRLGLLTRNVESLRVEQQKRQQQLDQPRKESPDGS